MYLLLQLPYAVNESKLIQRSMRNVDFYCRQPGPWFSAVNFIVSNFFDLCFFAAYIDIIQLLHNYWVSKYIVILYLLIRKLIKIQMQI
jgi:hypothetical protein